MSAKPTPRGPTPTPAQERVLAAVGELRAREDISPSLQELADYLGRSTTTVGDLITQLVAMGYLMRDQRRRRSLEVVRRGPSGSIPTRRSVELPLLGTIAAGKPISAQEDVEELVAIPESLIRYGESAFLLRVKGESMLGAGLLPGDLVVVNPTQSYNDGDIVAALVGDDEGADEATVKRYRTKNTKRGFDLHPENPVFKIERHAYTEIIGVVSGSIRRI